MSKLEVFEFLKKIESLVSARNALKRSVLMVGIFWRKFFFREKSFSRVISILALGQSDRSILEITISREALMLKMSKNSKKSKKMVRNRFWAKKIF